MKTMNPMSPVRVGRLGTLMTQDRLPLSSFERTTVEMSGPCGSSPVESVNLAKFSAARAELAAPVGVSANSATSTVARATTSGRARVLRYLRTRAAMARKV
jgi:hypothetical protein